MKIWHRKRELLLSKVVRQLSGGPEQSVDPTPHHTDRETEVRWLVWSEDLVHVGSTS